MGTPHYGRSSSQTRQIALQMLAEVAERLEERRPNETLTPAGHLAVLQATSMDPPMLRALRGLAPPVDGTITRRAYAAQLRAVVVPE
ncbi:hypothetical protein [Streptomyces sp. NPDC050264]|uniref:hypothetical protein n=1 Tax=Streptomyces sp. NPDC050264 TaxID=3155038 RepID=UPI0034177A18